MGEKDLEKREGKLWLGYDIREKNKKIEKVQYSILIWRVEQNRI